MLPQSVCSLAAVPEENGFAFGKKIITANCRVSFRAHKYADTKIHQAQQVI